MRAVVSRADVIASAESRQGLGRLLHMAVRAAERMRLAAVLVLGVVVAACAQANSTVKPSVAVSMAPRALQRLAAAMKDVVNSYPPLLLLPPQQMTKMSIQGSLSNTLCGKAHLESLQVMPGPDVVRVLVSGLSASCHSDFAYEVRRAAAGARARGW